MTTVGVGVDVVDVERFTKMLARRPSLEGRLFTERERHDTGSKPERLAARFAAKEAVLKALGGGIGSAAWHAIEVRRDPSGAPSIALHDGARSLATTAGVAQLHVSLSHSQLTAMALVVASSTGEHDAR